MKIKDMKSNIWYEYGNIERDYMMKKNGKYYFFYVSTEEEYASSLFVFSNVYDAHLHRLVDEDFEESKFESSIINRILIDSVFINRIKYE
jgi:hypothetical protein